MGKKEKNIKIILAIVLAIVVLSWFFGGNRCMDASSACVTLQQKSQTYVSLVVWLAEVVGFVLAVVALFVPFRRVTKRTAIWLALVIVAPIVGVTGVLTATASVVGDSAQSIMTTVGVGMFLVGSSLTVLSVIKLNASHPR
jgi:hypothetical protein